MVGWFGAAALALVGGLKGQGNHWRQIPFVGVLAATAFFISWRVRRGVEKDAPKSANVDDKTVVEVNTRVYLVYDEEKKLECSTSHGQSQPDAPEGGKLTGADDLVPRELEVDFTAADSSRKSQRAKCKLENRAGEERLPKRRNVSKMDVDCKDVEEISKAETTTHDGRPSAYKPSPSPESKITDISVSGFLLPQMTSQKLFMPPEIASIVEKGEPYEYELDAESLKAVPEDPRSYSPLHEKDIISISDVGSNGTPKDEHSTLGVSNGDFKQRILGPMERLEKVIKVVDGDTASDGTSRESGSGLQENENEIVDSSKKIRDSPEVLPHSGEGFASIRSSTPTHVLDLSGVRKEVSPSDRGSSTFREVRATWISPELQLDDWVSRRGDSEIEDGRLAHPSSAAEKYPSPAADSIPGIFPFSFSTSESCSSDAIDTKDELLLRSPPSNVKRINPHVKDLEQNSEKSSEEEYAERLRIYDEYLEDPSLSPRMRSQVLRAKTTLERLLYDSD